MLDLIAALIDDASKQCPYGLMKALDRIHQHEPNLASTRKFQRLASMANA
jgi:hypothetical protein